MSRIFENMLVGSQQTFVWNVGNIVISLGKELSVFGDPTTTLKTLR